jgi:predicted DNA-binding protein
MMAFWRKGPDEMTQRLKDLATDCFGRVDSYQIRDMEKMKVS